MRIRFTWVTLPLFLLLFWESVALAAVFPYTERGELVGAVRSYVIKGDESLIEIARRYDIGYNAITAANPFVDPFVPGEGTKIVLPESWILPDVEAYRGIIINLSELRLYHFYRRGGTSYVETYPIGIGISGKDTPVGAFKIIEKIRNPVWDVPESIRKEHPELPKSVPPGPDNPLGSHALRLSLGDVLIHGTNKPYGLGMKVSHGCIRLSPSGIERLYASVARNSRVLIVRQPVKIGVKDDRVYIEVYDDEPGIDYYREAMRLLDEKGLLRKVNTEKLRQTLKDMRAIPVEITVTN